MKGFATLIVLLLAAQATADVRIIPAAAHTPGANGTFWRTQLTLLNPGSTPVTIEARILGGPSRTATVQPAATLRYEDVLTDLFEMTGIAAIVLRSDALFEAASRTYTTGPCGTFGQSAPSVNSEAAITSGLFPSLAGSTAFRTNLGFVNLSDNPAALTIRPGSGPVQSVAVPPRTSTQFPLQGGGELRFESDVPVIAYASTVDNGSGDADFVFAVRYRGESARVFEVEARQFRFVVTPGGAETIHVRKGDQVILRIRSSDTLHGFIMPDLIAHQTLMGEAPAVEISFTAESAGTFPFFCTIECGSGHHGMRGQMVVSP